MFSKLMNYMPNWLLFSKRASLSRNNIGWKFDLNKQIKEF